MVEGLGLVYGLGYRAQGNNLRIAPHSPPVADAAILALENVSLGSSRTHGATWEGLQVDLCASCH